MTESKRLQKAKLIELNPDRTEKSGGKEVTVQFNPETLKVSFANQIVQPNNAGSGGGSSGDQSNSASRQFVGAGTTKLSFQLWFDIGSQSSGDSQTESDVRELTKNVAYFITPHKDGEQYIPPAARFLWGSFQFDGMFDAVEESLEFFSDEGIPLRATVSVNMSQQRIEEYSGKQGGLGSSSPPGSLGIGGAPPGTIPLTQANAGDSLQSIAAAAGLGGSWQAIAEANGIENPRQIQPGTLINLNIGLGK
jgi:hypothetical protein